jgi:hypothetical protein
MQGNMSLRCVECGKQEWKPWKFGGPTIFSNFFCVMVLEQLKNDGEIELPCLVCGRRTKFKLINLVEFEGNTFIIPNIPNGLIKRQ